MGPVLGVWLIWLMALLEASLASICFERKYRSETAHGGQILCDTFDGSTVTS